MRADVTAAATACVPLRSNRIRGCRSSLGVHAASRNLRYVYVGDNVQQFRHFDLELDEPSVPIEAGKRCQ